MNQSTLKLIAAACVVALPAVATAGPPLICQPFETNGTALLQWGSGPGWNTPDPNYDVRRLRADLLRLLTRDAPVLSRMENMRRAAIYAARDPKVAKEVLQAVLARAMPGTEVRAGTEVAGTEVAGTEVAGTEVNPAALFDAGYLIESYKQAAHLHRGPGPTRDGYAMVVRAISATGGQAEMEFAAALMTQGAQAEAHLRRARARAGKESLLARNIDNTGR